MASSQAVPARRFNLLAASLRHLLELDDDARLTRTGGTLRLSQDGVTLPVSEHSDGYRSMVAFTTDLMLNLSGHWDSMEAAEGLVLVDELEVHLHPTWRMTAVERLRSVFPRLRFVITTHDPLCLRGGEPGEVYVLQREDETNEVVARQRDIPPGLTADDLLTGSWFGMATTLDSETVGLLQEHGNLLLEKQTPKVKQERHRVETLLRERRGTFADTNDERLVRTVVEELRAERPGLMESDRLAAREAVLERVRADGSREAPR